MAKSILIAGIGNIFHGDDAFGVIVAQRLAGYGWPENVRVVDFGIRAIDLAFAFLDGYDLTILIDVVARGGTPGTLYTIEPDIDALLEGRDALCVNSHALDPATVLMLAKNMGAEFRRVLIVGCEPLVLEAEDGRMGLSEAVEASVEPAIEMIGALVREDEQDGKMTMYAEAKEVG